MQLDDIYAPRPMSQNSNFTSRVDIIIPFHGQYDYVTRLLESIMRLTVSSPYEICLVDDCSPNAAYIQHLKSAKIANLKCIRNETQLGFGGAMKAGFANTNNPWIVFMNSDCEVQDIGWLRNLGESSIRMKSQGVRMVFPRTNNALLDEKELQFSKDEKAEDAVYKGEYIPMYCFMVHRELFQRVGGFIKTYPYGGYEDIEFAHRLKKYNYKQGISGASWVYHKGGVTCLEVNRDYPKTKLIMEKDNWARCIEDLKKLNIAS